MDTQLSPWVRKLARATRAGRGPLATLQKVGDKAKQSLQGLHGALAPEQHTGGTSRLPDQFGSSQWPQISSLESAASEGDQPGPTAGLEHQPGEVKRASALAGGSGTIHGVAGRCGKCLEVFKFMTVKGCCC